MVAIWALPILIPNCLELVWVKMEGNVRSLLIGIFVIGPNSCSSQESEFDKTHG
jgi:hypothetical protein